MFRNFFRKTPLAWLQVKREKTRLAVALAGIAFADVLMFVQLGLKDALYDSAASPYQALQGDLFIVNPLFESLNVFRSFPRARLQQAAGADGVESVTHLYIDRGQWRNPDTRLEKTILVFGIDPVKPAIALPDVKPHLQELQLLNRVLYDRAGRADFFGNVPAMLQQTNPLPIQINSLETQVTGTFTLGASFSADGNAITSDSTFLRLFPERKPEQIDVGILTLKSNTDIQQIQAVLKANLPKDIVVLTQEEFVAREKQYWSTGSPIGFIFGFGTIIGFIVGIVIVYQILYSDVSEHLPEYATLKAMGYSDSYLVGVLVQESLILACLGFIPGFALSIGLYSITKSATLLPIAMTMSRAAMVLVLTIVMCVASGGVAMRKLQAADPADIFSRETTPMHPVISACHLNHYFGEGELRKQALFDINLDIHAGEIVIMTGPSGSGKTTLLTLMGGLRSAQEGSLKILGQEICGASKQQLTQLRKQIGYIFQAHNLLTFLTAKQNVQMSLELHDEYLNQDIGAISTEILEAVGLGHRIDYYADSLSGGQKQRVAIARALVSRPKIVLADEPTAALDKKSGRDVVEMMQKLAKQQGCTILLVTHDNRILDIADRIVYMEDGRLVTQSNAVAVME